jgi:putative transposase
MLRKFTKTKTVYPTDDAVRKSVYLSILDLQEMEYADPELGDNNRQLMIFFEDRFLEKSTS